jgi:hypothetical protein
MADERVIQLVGARVLWCSVGRDDDDGVIECPHAVAGPVCAVCAGMRVFGL